MENYIEFFNSYIMGIAQILAGFHYYTKYLNKKVSVIFYLLFSLFGTVVITVIRNNGVYSFLVYILLLVIWGFFVYRASFGAAVVYAVITSEVMLLCYGIFDSVLSILYPLLFSFLHNLVNFVFMFLGNMAIFAVIYCFQLIYRYFAGGEMVDGQYVTLILMPILLIYLISGYINFTVYGNSITIDDRGNIINMNHYQMLAIQVLGLASLFCVMAACRKLLENIHFNTELSLLRQQEHFLNQYVEEAKAHYESTKSFRHDIKNHIIVLKELLQNNKRCKALEYINDMEEIAREMSFPYNTGNPVVDILIGNKLGIANRNGINVCCSLALPYPCPIRDIDLCIILSNALDNAVCACKNMNMRINAEKYIHVNGNIQGDLVLIEIENSFDGDGAFKEGTGLSNIRKVAGKYQGAVNIKSEDAKVVLSVLLIIS